MEKILLQLKNIESLIIRGSKEVLTASEAALYLGVSERHIYKLTAGKKLEHWKPEGKHVYFKRSSLDKYILRNRVCTSEELQEQAIAYVNAPKKRGGRK